MVAPSYTVVVQRKTKVFVISSSDFEKSRILDQDPQPFFLGYYRLAQKFYDLRMKVVQSLRTFNFSNYTPLIQEIFPDLDLGIHNSGINVLFTPPKRGRDQVKRTSRNERDKRWIWSTCPRIVPQRKVFEGGALSESKLVRDLSWINLRVTQTKFSIWQIFYFKQEISNWEMENFGGVERSI